MIQLSSLRPSVLYSGAALLLLSVGLIVYSVVVTVQQVGTMPIEVRVLPTNATVVVSPSIKTRDGKTLHLKPGTYSYTVSAEGFTSRTGSLEVVTGTSNQLFIALEATSQEAKNWYTTNAKVVAEYEARSQELTQAYSKAAGEKNPITRYLPMNGGTFAAGYRMDPTDKTGMSIIVTIKGDAMGYQYVLSKLYELGVDPADYKISFLKPDGSVYYNQEGIE